MFNSKRRKEYKKLKAYRENLEAFVRMNDNGSADLSKWMNLMLMETMNTFGSSSGLKEKIEREENRIQYFKNNFSDSYKEFNKGKNRNDKIDDLLWEGQ